MATRPEPLLRAAHAPTSSVSETELVSGARGVPSISSLYTLAIAVAVCSAAIAVLGAAVLDLPIRDPDGVAGPAWIRLPGIVGVFLALDIIPRGLLAWWRGRGASDESVGACVIGVARARWSRERIALVAVGLASFYLTYLSYRNIKSFLPFVYPESVDELLLGLDRVAFLGHDPASVLHAVLGTGLAAGVLSVIYVAFLAFVPLSLAAALVWARDAARGAMYATALSLNWALGALAYYLLPSLGPVYEKPSLFAALPETGVTALQDTLLARRFEVLTGPWATDALQGIGAFPSLHVSIVLTAALVVHRLALPRLLRGMMWVFFVLTAISTVYFGWHYLVDIAGGVGIAWLSVAAAAAATGVDRRSAKLQTAELQAAEPAAG